MQHDHILKSWIFTNWHHREGWGGYGSAGNIFATYSSWFPLNEYATWPCSRKVKFWPTDPIPRVGGGGRGLRTKYLLPCCFILWFSLNWYATWPCSEKVEFWPISPIPGSRLSAGKVFATLWLHSWFSLIWYAAWPFSEKKMTLDLPDPIPMTWCPKISAWCVNMKHYTDNHHGDYIFVVSSLNLNYV